MRRFNSTMDYAVLTSKREYPVIFLFFVSIFYLLSKLATDLCWAKASCLLVCASVLVPELYNRFLNTPVRKWLCGMLWNMPPGPKSTSLIWGYLDSLGAKSHLQLHELSKKFGKIFSVNYGFEKVVILSDYELIRQCMNKDVFSARPDIKMINLIEGYGIINAQGTVWKNHRTFVKKQLRQSHQQDMNSLENRIEHEVGNFMSNMAQVSVKDFDISAILAAAVCNIICSLIMSVRFHHTDAKFLRLKQLMDEGFLYFLTTAKVNYVPFADKFGCFNDNYNKLKQNKNEMGAWVNWIIEMHKENFDPQNPKDLVDQMLLQAHNAKKTGSKLFLAKNTDRQINQTLIDMFSAGQETVRSTVLWFIVYMLHNPHILRNIQKELDEIVGRSRLPNIQDMPKCTYTVACMMELFRCSSVVGQATPHATTHDTTIGEYAIPKGTHVTPLLYAVHMNPENFPEPHVFNPNRFINEDGKIFKPKCYIPFSVGRRMCLGDKLAEKEVFLFMSSLAHLYNFEIPQNKRLPSLEGNFFTTCVPEAFTITLTPRQRNFAFDHEENESKETMWLLFDREETSRSL